MTGGPLFFVFCFHRRISRCALCTSRQTGKLGQTSSGSGSVSVQSVVIVFPAVCFSRGVTNDLCKAITGAALWAVYLRMGLRHCHSHLHVGFLLIFHSHTPICLSPPPNVPPPPVMNSFSRFSLPVSSPSFILPFFFVWRW